MAESSINGALAPEELIRALPVALVTLAPSGLLTAVNPAAAEIFGMAPGQGAALSALFRGSYFDPTRAILGTLERAGAWEGELLFVARGGKERRLCGRFVRLANREGMAAGLLEDGGDLSRLRARLEEAERLLSVGRMAGGIAHNVNNAMVAVLGYSSMMQETFRNDERLSRYMGRVVSAAHRAADLVRQFLSFSQKGAARPVLLNVGDVAEVAAKLFVKAHPVKVQANCEISPDLPNLYAIPSDLEHAFNSLFALIMAQADEGPITLEVTAHLAQSNECIVAANTSRAREAVVVEVHAHGGFGQKPELDAWFARIAGGSGTSGQAAQEAGDPLALSAAFIRETLSIHHGWATAEATAADAIAIRLYFPTRAALEDGSQTDVSPHLGATAPAIATGPHTAIRPATVLVIDDELIVLDLVMDLLTESGFKVLAANGGRKGLGKALSVPELDLVLLDRAMPDMDGLDVYLRLRKSRPELPVLVSSGHSVEDSKAGLPEDPHLSYIQKPYHFADLVLAINRMLR